MQFEYLVCQTQYSRVTFVNGDWQGRAVWRLDPAIRRRRSIHVRKSGIISLKPAARVGN